VVDLLVCLIERFPYDWPQVGFIPPAEPNVINIFSQIFGDLVGGICFLDGSLNQLNQQNPWMESAGTRNF